MKEQKLFTSAQSFSSHIKIKQQEIRYNCQQCYLEFLNTQTLRPIMMDYYLNVLGKKNC